MEALKPQLLLLRFFVFLAKLLILRLVKALVTIKVCNANQVITVLSFIGIG